MQAVHAGVTALTRVVAERGSGVSADRGATATSTCVVGMIGRENAERVYGI